MHQYVKNLEKAKENIAIKHHQNANSNINYGGNGNILPEILIATKGKTIGEIEPLIQHQHRLFGENKVQEAKEKWIDSGLKQKICQNIYPNDKIRLHLIGSLQTNKVKDALAIFDEIATLDREKLANTIKKAISSLRDQFNAPSLLIQVNTGGEASKSGILPREADDFINFCKFDLQLPIIGLMCIPPPPHMEDVAVHFKILQNLAKNHKLKKLSMGMSQDYEIASLFGSSEVRLGRAIFCG